MEIKLASVSDAPTIHALMIQAFMEYKNEVPPSSALDETVESIASALMEDELACIAYEDGRPAGMVRFTIEAYEVYFFRLSVLPEKRGQGVAKKLIHYLEDYAMHRGMTSIRCKVRKTIAKNVQLYHSLGFQIENEEILHRNDTVLHIVTMKKRID